MPRVCKESWRQVLVRKVGGRFCGEDLSVKDRVEVAFHYVSVIFLWLLLLLFVFCYESESHTVFVCLGWFM